LVVETSSVGYHTTGFVRFENKEHEQLYEKHLLEVHGMMK